MGFLIGTLVAPNLWKIGNYLQEPSNPYNSFEPIDSSAAAIGAQGLMRLGKYLNNDYYFKTGLTVLKALLNEPYLSSNPNHQGYCYTPYTIVQITGTISLKTPKSLMESLPCGETIILGKQPYM